VFSGVTSTLTAYFVFDICFPASLQNMMLFIESRVLGTAQLQNVYCCSATHQHFAKLNDSIHNDAAIGRWTPRGVSCSAKWTTDGRMCLLWCLRYIYKHNDDRSGWRMDISISSHHHVWASAGHRKLYSPVRPLLNSRNAGKC